VASGSPSLPFSFLKGGFAPGRLSIKSSPLFSFERNRFFWIFKVGGSFSTPPLIYAARFFPAFPISLFFEQTRVRWISETENFPPFFPFWLSIPEFPPFLFPFGPEKLSFALLFSFSSLRVRWAFFFLFLASVPSSLSVWRSQKEVRLSSEQFHRGSPSLFFLRLARYVAAELVLSLPKVRISPARLC